MIAYASRGTEVRAHPPLQPGDEVSVTVEQLGTLTTRIVQGAEPVPIRPARRDR
jgi:2-keto-4-pentenoate hydratase/2-oxohepta-3-ene-1,7-dioic acid hydratase in catechol pathway